MSEHFCVSCRRPLNEGRYCPFCGADQTNAGRQAQVSPSEAATTTLREKRTGCLGGCLGLTAVVIGIVIVLTVISPNSSDAVKQDRNPAPAVPAEAPSETKAPMHTANDEKRLAQLKTHFVITKDEFNGVVTYRHRAFSKYMNGNGTTIKAEIREKDGHNGIFAESQFVSDDWIFHTSYELRADGVIPVASLGETQREVINGGGICEVVRSTPEVSVIIAAAIKAAADHHKPVRVRLEGKFYKDYTLRPVYEKAIAETYELYSLIASNP